jgi:hypothetical protein
METKPEKNACQHVLMKTLNANLSNIGIVKLGFDGNGFSHNGEYGVKTNPERFEGARD